MNFSPLNLRRYDNFKANKRGWYSFWIFSFLFVLSILANIIANDKPLIIKFDNNYYFPIIYEYSETLFGGDFEGIWVTFVRDNWKGVLKVSRNDFESVWESFGGKIGGRRGHTDYLGLFFPNSPAEGVLKE